MADPLPPPGPDHYTERRARWLSADVRPARHAHPSHARLHRLLDSPDPHSDPVWHRGLDQVWNGLSKGNRLKHRLPMSIVIKVIYAAWRRDPTTWPEGAAAPDSDDARTVATTSHAPVSPSAEPP